MTARAEAQRPGVERLGTQSIGKLLLEMSSQTTLSLLVYAIYNVTDIYFLSVGVGSLAAAGASIISPVLIGLGGVSTTVGSGAASVVSRALGEANREKASKTVANTFLLFWTVALLITLFGALFIEPIVYLFGATSNVAPYAIDYGRIIFLGAITSTGFSAIIRADGNVRYSTAIWIIPVSANLVLCWLFVIVMHMGASGAALATVMGQAISAGMSIYFFFFRRNRSYKIVSSHFKPDLSIIREVIVIGFPSFIKGMSTSLLGIVTNNLLNAIGGDNALSVFAIVNRLYSSLSIVQLGIVQGMQPVLGYNFGRKQYTRVRKTVTYALGGAVAYGLIVCGVCLLIPAALVGLLSSEPSIIDAGQSALILMSLAFPLGGISVLVAAYFQALGNAKGALLITLGGILLIKLPVLLLAAQFFSLTGIWLSEAISEAFLCGIALIMLRNYQHSLPISESPDLRAQQL